MIYFHVALPFEGNEIIEYFQMKMFSGNAGSKFYKADNGEASLVISGVGDFKSSCAVSCLFSLIPPKNNDIFVNYGIVGSGDDNIKLGDLVRIVKCSKDKERSIYPDILYGVNQKVKYVYDETVVGAACIENKVLNTVFDNELYGALFSANLFLPSENCFSFKVVSDMAVETNMKKGKIDASFAKKVCEEKVKEVIDFSVLLQSEVTKEKDNQPVVFSKEEKEIINQIEGIFEITYATCRIFESLVYRDKCLGENVVEKLSAFFDNVTMPETKDAKRLLFSNILEEKHFI